jgi:hypothetical protein
MDDNAQALETQRVADRLVELCSAGKWHEAASELYAEDARHVEAMAMPGSPYGRITQGQELQAMQEQFDQTTEVHGQTVSKPLVNGDQFVCDMTIDCTHKQGPMAGQRQEMSETCLYTVKDGKITEAKFFYSM